jgi:hypothetical protein
MSYQDEMARKHASHIAAHERSYGAKLGELRDKPTKGRLNKDFEKRKKDRTLFTQMPNLEISKVGER